MTTLPGRVTRAKTQPPPRPLPSGTCISEQELPTEPGPAFLVQSKKVQGRPEHCRHPVPLLPLTPALSRMVSLRVTRWSPNAHSEGVRRRGLREGMRLRCQDSGSHEGLAPL